MMNTPAQRRLLDAVAEFMGSCRCGSIRLLNIGAGKSIVLEKSLAERGCSFVCDRLDIDDCTADHPNVGNCFQCSAERMEPLVSENYDAVFSNYVLEHIEDLDSAISEVRRILKPGGIGVFTIPNPRAPEFSIARRTPLWFHRMVRGGSGWHTHYAYPSVKALADQFARGGFEVKDIKFYPCVEQYVERFRALRWAGVLYDTIVRVTGCSGLMGNVCFVVRKPDAGTTRDTAGVGSQSVSEPVY